MYYNLGGIQMIISHIIFIKTKKAAGTSIETYLSQYCGENDILTPVGKESETEKHVPKNWKGFFNPIPEIVKCSRSLRDIAEPVAHALQRKKFYNHIPAFRARERIPAKIWNSYYKFCVERNPWDKTLSHYYYTLKKRSNNKLAFEEYVKRGRFCLNYPLYMDPQHRKIIVDRVIKYENLNEELGEVFDYLGIPFEGSLPVRAKSHYRKDRRPYWEVFSNELKEYRDVIPKIFKKEIELLGYTFRGVK